MGRWRIRRSRAVIAVAAAVALIVAGLSIAWVRRTAPPWPEVAGTPYRIATAADGCPIAGERPPAFVDAPGQFVPPYPSEAVLCTTPTALFPPAPGEAEAGQQQVLSGDAAIEFAAHLNRLPDRNVAWRRWQRKHSGWWPDSAANHVEGCLMIGYPYDRSFVLRYPDRPPVALVFECGGTAGGLTSGAKTRMDWEKPHAFDTFLALFEGR